jgi:hypothetical protein
MDDTIDQFPTNLFVIFFVQLWGKVTYKLWYNLCITIPAASTSNSSSEESQSLKNDQNDPYLAKVI